MIFVLNMIPWMIIALGVYLGYISRKNPKRLAGVIVATVLALIIYNGVQPSYIPKGTVNNTLSIPEIVVPVTPIEVEDRLRKPISDEVQAERMEQKFDWKSQVNANKSETKEQ